MHKGRLLDSHPGVLHFLKQTIGIQCSMEQMSDLVNKICRAENLVRTYSEHPTVNDNTYRDINYCDNTLRSELRNQIVMESITMPLLEQEDAYKLGSGGLLPPSDVCEDKFAVIVTGLPASGKSTIARKIAVANRAVFLDSDLIKRKFPEMVNEYGADVLQKESGLVTFGGALAKEYGVEYDVQSYCVAKGFNIVIQKVGDDEKKIRTYRDQLIAEGYSVSHVYVHVDRKVAVKRAITRYEQTNRYVPLSLIHDDYSLGPLTSYYRMRDDAAWSSTAKVDTETTVNSTFRIVETRVRTGACPVKDLEGAITV